jgi:hypothetical protein
MLAIAPAAASSQTAAGRLVFHFDDTVPSDQGIMRVYDATLDGTAELVFDAPPEIGVWYTGMWAVDEIIMASLTA